MRSSLPKVMQPVGGRPMLAHVLDTAGDLGPERIDVVYGHRGEALKEAFADAPVSWVLQEPRLGTGHAVLQAIPDIPDQARVLVLNGDHPLVPVRELLKLMQEPADTLAFLTMKLNDPAGYGRVLRNDIGAVIGVVEHKDADAEQRRIGEVNTGVIAAPAKALRKWLSALDNDNAQNEYYLTDVIESAANDSTTISGLCVADPALMAGANDRHQLVLLEQSYRRMRAEELLSAGVTLIDPARVDVRGVISVGEDVIIDVNVVIEGDVTLGDGVRIGPFCHIKDATLAPATVVHSHSVLEGVRSAGACDIGPYARLRPGTILEAGCRVGNFVETKNTTLGSGSKANHLTYLGDCEVGEGVNIGAGTITCNYDGVNKHKTVIEDGAFIGSDTQLVAPVKVGKNATIGAGSTITNDAPDDELSMSRTRQEVVPGWRRPGGD